MIEQQRSGTIGVVAVAGVVAFLVAGLLVSLGPGLVHWGGSDLRLLRDEHEIGVFQDRASFIYDQGLPYRDHRIEYPPLGVAYLTVPALFAETESGYRQGLVIQNAIVALLTMLVTLALIRRTGSRPALAFLFLLPSFVYFTLNRFDIWPVFLVQVALLLLLKQKFSWSFLLLGLAFLAKGYAIIFFPIFFLYYLVKTQTVQVNVLKNRQLLLTALPIVTMVIFFIAVAGAEGLFPYYFQSTRNIGYGSLFAIYVAELLPILPGWLSHWGMKLSTMLLALLQFTLPVFAYLGYRRAKNFITTPVLVALGCITLLVVYLLFSGYYSPQWFVWLLPLLVLVPWRAREVLLLVVLDIVNYLAFPLAWDSAGPGSTIFSIFVLVRTILMVLLALLVLQRLVLPHHHVGQKRNLEPGSVPA